MDNTPKIAVITGASRGIGLAIAEAFAALGFTLVLSARNQIALEETAKNIRERFEVKVHAFAADLSLEIDCKKLVSEVARLGDKIDVLVNNAGVFLPGTLMEEPEDQMDFQMRTNFFSAYFVTKGIWPLMQSNRRAHIFNLCSIASIQAYDAGGGYAVTKHALLGFSKSLRREGIARNIRVSAVLPGATLTDSWAGVDLPESRFMKPEDVAAAIVMAWEVNERTVMEEILLRPILGDV